MTEQEKIDRATIIKYLAYTPTPLRDTRRIGVNLFSKPFFDSTHSEYRYLLKLLHQMKDDDLLYRFYSPHDGNLWMLRARDRISEWQQLRRLVQEAKNDD